MNILFISGSFNPCEGGVSRVTDILAHEFVRRGLKVVYLSYKTKQENGDCESDFPIYYMNCTIDEPYNKNSVEIYHSVLRENAIDVAINQYPILRKNDFFLEHKLPSVKVVSFFHSKPTIYSRVAWANFREEKIGFAKLRRFLSFCRKYVNQVVRFNAIISKSDKMCLLSQRFYPDLFELVPWCDKEKLYAIGNPNTFSEALPVDYNQKENIILFVGRLGDRTKNLRGFIKIWERLYRNNPQWKVVIVGDDTKIAADKEYIANRGIANIKFVGFSDNVREYYKRAKIFAMTSHAEGWPMTITEAMALGCVPSAYTTYESVYELITDDEDGFLVKPYDEKEMAERMQYLMDNEPVLRRMSQCAQRDIKKHGASIVAEKWEAFFDQFKK